MPDTRRPFRLAAISVLVLLIVGCAGERSATAPRAPAGGAAGLEHIGDGPPGLPEDEGLDSRVLLAMTEWIRDRPVPIYSLLISRNGRLVYELYTSRLTRDHAHYQMSVTKSVLSALVGAAIDRRVIGGPDARIVDTLPRHLFASDADVARFRPVTVRHVLGMSVLDAPDPPRVRTPEAIARQARFRAAPNRVRFALEQPLLATPGHAYQYNDVTPTLASGLVQYATGTGALEFAEETLFRPMGFRNHEWMHQDRAGIDLGGFGLRLRPIDMQKFGLLYLSGGTWDGRALLSERWIERSFTPWNHSATGLRDPNYGWFWWALDGRTGWSAHGAVGWKGQRIAVLARLRLVVTLTGCIEDGTEQQVFADLMERFVLPSVRGDAARPVDPAIRARLAAVMAEVRTGPSRIAVGTEDRMIPSIAPKSRRVPFTGSP